MIKPTDIHKCNYLKNIYTFIGLKFLQFESQKFHANLHHKAVVLLSTMTFQLTYIFYAFHGSYALPSECEGNLELSRRNSINLFVSTHIVFVVKHHSISRKCRSFRGRHLLILSTRTIDITIASTLAYQAITNRHHSHARYVQSPTFETMAVHARRAVNAFSYHVDTLANVRRVTSESLCVWDCPCCLRRITVAIHPSREEVQNASHTLQDAYAMRKRRRIPTRLPKSIRILAAYALSKCVNDAVNSENPSDWNKLIFIALIALGIENNSHDMKKRSLAAQIRSSTSDFVSNDYCHMLDTPVSSELFTQSKNLLTTDNRIKKHASNKLVLADAVRVVASHVSVDEFTPEVLETLRYKHPSSMMISAQSLYPPLVCTSRVPPQT